MSLGPIQLLVVGFDDERPRDAIRAELQRLREHDVIRLVDLLVVSKSDDGDITIIETSDLGIDDAMELGAIAGALVGLGAAGEEGAEIGAELGAAAMSDGVHANPEEVWFVADAIPPGSTAAIAVIEHRWAIPLRDAIRDAGGVALADEWIHPEDLVAVGIEAAAG